MLIRLFGLMFLRGAVYGTVAPFISILLLRAGLPLGFLGPLAGAGAVITLVMAPWWGRLGDLYGRRRVYVMTNALAIGILFAFTSDALPVLVVANLAWAFVSSSFVPLIDSFTLDRLDGARTRFARARMGGSLGYAILVIGIGAAITYGAVAWDTPGLAGGLIATATALVVALRLRDELRTGRGVAWAPGDDGRRRRGTAFGVPSTADQVRRYRPFLLGLVGVFATVSTLFVYVPARIASLGGTGLDIGLGAASPALAELPALLGLSVFLRRFGTKATFAIGATALLVAALLVAFLPSPTLVVLALALFGLGFAWTTLPSMAALAASGGPRERASLTGLHFATSAAGTLVVATLGFVLLALPSDLPGTTLMLALGAWLAPLGAVVALRGWPAPVGSVPVSALVEPGLVPVG